MWLLVGITLLAALLTVAGPWRLFLRFFRLDAQRMTVERLGLLIPESDVYRVEEIFRSFSGGFNAMLCGPSRSWERTCDSLPALYQPFAHEGAAMGYTLRRMFCYDSADFETALVSRRPEFRYLYYVGLGFWWGMRNVGPRQVAARVQGLDPLYRFLCFDGYGFKRAFFDQPKEPEALRSLDALPGYAAHAAYHGVGRAFWFRFMGDPAVLIRQINALGDYAAAATAGVGLASVFVNPDRLTTALGLARQIPEPLQPHMHLGMCFGLKARSLNDPGQFGRDTAGVDPEVRMAIRASIQECDRVEQRVRSDGKPDAYRRWREQVTAWMVEHIEYPLLQLNSGTLSRPQPIETELAGISA